MGFQSDCGLLRKAAIDFIWLIACHSHDNRSELLSKQVGKILLAINTDLIRDQLIIG